MKSFPQWTMEEVESEFSVLQIKESSLLTTWLTDQVPPSEMETLQLERLRSLLDNRVYDWNEYALAANFIGPLLVLVDFDQPLYKSYMQRTLTASYNSTDLSGIVDFVVATNNRSPKSPYFFIHEYKKERDRDNDPLGQFMIAMITARLLNQNENLMYGAYVMRRMWYFVILKGKGYVVHHGLNASSHEIEKVFGILQNMKRIVEELINSSKK